MSYSSDLWTRITGITHWDLSGFLFELLLNAIVTLKDIGITYDLSWVSYSSSMFQCIEFHHIMSAAICILHRGDQYSGLFVKAVEGRLQQLKYVWRKIHDLFVCRDLRADELLTRKDVFCVTTCESRPSVRGLGCFSTWANCRYQFSSRQCGH